MEVILKEDVPNLGNMGEVVTVKPGYGRNFLIPQGKAVPATEDNVSKFEVRRAELEAAAAETLAAAQARGEALTALGAVEIAATAGEEGKLFGSVTNRDIAEKLAEAGVEIDRRAIGINEAIKETGAYDVSIKLGLDLTATLKVYVVGA